MNSSLRLLLEDFLGLMREDGELDAFLPLLMVGMGHEVIYRAQKGVRQYGVDITSVGPGELGEPTLYMWLVKRGDIGRKDWDTGPQSIRQSMEEVADVYLQTHVAPQYLGLPKKLLVVTNGDFDSTLVLNIAAYLKTWQRTHRCKVETINGSRLAALTEENLLDENVLATEHRKLLRRMLANVGSPELCIDTGRMLVDALVEIAARTDGTAGAQRKRRLMAFRGIRTALRVLTVWAEHEENLTAPYHLSEYAVLRFWASFHPDGAVVDADIRQELAELLFQLGEVALKYHLKLREHYRVQNALALAYPDSLLVSGRAFSELGRLSLQGLLWAFFAVDAQDALAEHYARFYIDCVVSLLASHECTQSPPYDHNSVDVHLALLLLMVGRREVNAMNYVAALATRLNFVAGPNRYAPLNASFEDALRLRREGGEVDEEFISISTLIPILLVWAAALGLDDAYQGLRKDIAPKMSAATFNLWSSDVGFDAAVADPRKLHGHGVGEALQVIDENPAELLERLHKPTPGVQSIEEAPWYKARLTLIPLLAAMHWRMQVPREMLVKHVSAVAGLAPDSGLP
jgi:hypothetical protein